MLAAPVVEAAAARRSFWRFFFCCFFEAAVVAPWGARGLHEQTALDVLDARARAPRTCRAVLILVLVFLRILLLVRLLMILIRDVSRAFIRMARARVESRVPPSRPSRRISLSHSNVAWAQAAGSGRSQPRANRTR